MYFLNVSKLYILKLYIDIFNKNNNCIFFIVIKKYNENMSVCLCFVLEVNKKCV